MPKKLLPVQEKRVYKNSECELCPDYLRAVKLKEHPLTKEMIICCKDCYSELYLKSKKDE
tara:strand:+ start:61 stop:240 length:180 start_codon:yes stop_codon:yes gene_type:complete